MLLIIEGIDRVGKTTLQNYLGQKDNVIVFKPEYKYIDFNKDNELSNVPRFTEFDTVVTLAEAGAFDDKVLVLDRFHVSEIVYSLVRPRRVSDLRAMNDVDERVSKLKSLLVQISPVSLEESSKQHGDDLAPEQELFTHYCRKSKIKNKLFVDYNNMFRLVEYFLEQYEWEVKS